MMGVKRMVCKGRGRNRVRGRSTFKRAPAAFSVYRRSRFKPAPAIKSKPIPAINRKVKNKGM